ncbi:MAG: phytoene dehydrogenase-like protein [Polyangiales bacterium]|jgi:phytoene dehydrogenase-like protein
MNIIVIGGGLAGLCAGNFLARGGAKVSVWDPKIGGRARSNTTKGVVFNQGPHALYLGGQTAQILRELSVPWTGRGPTKGMFLTSNDVHYPFPTSAWSLLRCQALSGNARFQVGRVMARLPSALPKESVDAWVRRAVRADDARSFLSALVRLSTYGGDPSRFSAEVAIRQLRFALGKGVAYVDGGWQSIVDGLQQAAVTASAKVIKRTAAELTQTHLGWRVRGRDGHQEECDGVVLALPPERAASLYPSLKEKVATLEAVRVSSLDVALDGLPNPDVHFGLGLESPLYMSNHSVAQLAPEGTHVIHVAKYLGTDSPTGNERAELEDYLDSLQGGWRERVLRERYLPNIVVHHAMPTAERDGFGGQTPVALTPTLCVAGDWVGQEGLLADAACASGRAAARALLVQLGGEKRQSA